MSDWVWGGLVCECASVFHAKLQTHYNASCLQPRETNGGCSGQELLLLGQDFC